MMQRHFGTWRYLDMLDDWHEHKETVNLASIVNRIGAFEHEIERPTTIKRIEDGAVE